MNYVVMCNIIVYIIPMISLCQGNTYLQELLKESLLVVLELSLMSSTHATMVHNAHPAGLATGLLQAVKADDIS